MDKRELAENIVSRWYSLTRGREMNEPPVVNLLVSLVCRPLVNQGVNPLIASQMTSKAIDSWARECHGLPLLNLAVFEVLEVKILEIL